MMVDWWFKWHWEVVDNWVRMESKCISYQVAGPGSKLESGKDIVWEQGRKVFNDAKSGLCRSNIRRKGEMSEGMKRNAPDWKSFEMTDFYAVRDYLQTNPNTKNLETFDLYYGGEDYELVVPTTGYMYGF